MLSVADKNATWSLRQFPIGEWQHRPLGFGSKALWSSVDYYFPLKKWPLFYYWTLSRHWILNHESSSYHSAWVAPITWVRSNKPTHKVEHAEQHSILKWKRYMKWKWNWTQEGTKGTWSEPNVHVPHSYYTTFSLLASTYALTGNSLLWVDRGRKRRMRPLLQIVLHKRQALPKSGQLWHNSPFPGQPWSAPGFSLCLQGEMVRHMIINQVMSCGQWF